MSDVAETLSRWLQEYGSPGANAAELLCDRHDPAAVAFRFVDVAADGDPSCTTTTYGDLAEGSRRLATALAGRGIRRGDRVAVLMSKRPELVLTLLAIWRLGAVHVPLFTAFAEGAIRLRVESAGVRLVVTEPAERPKLDALDGLDVLVTGDAFDELVAGSRPWADAEAVGGDGALLQLYTSGTTGKPKGVVVPVRALASFHCYLHHGLGVTPDDVYWNAADPGWAYGLYYGIVAPLLAGRANLLFRGNFTPASTVAVMRTFGVTNFAGAPTIYRALSKSGAVEGVTLRRASSAGEPLTPDVVAWGEKTFGTPIRDHYGQTELGMVIGNHWHEDVVHPIRDGSMGRALPGITADVVGGQIAIDATASPLFWFAGYHEAPERTAERFTGDGRWYLTGDTGRVDPDGYFFFAARDDDVILAAGYRIGPFDVESVLITHPEVTDVAVVGRPDPEGIRGEVVEAFVVTAAGVTADRHQALAGELQALVRDGYSRHAYPRTVHFVPELPKTPSGKIQRYLLRDR
ncbi:MULTISPECIES: AMP-binding protein [Pseudonocardia]|uniref:Acetyl-coenzyme A synthetase n=2 Tax=Pseudonocardia TaxID=1847 RepID=A0A1Y2N9L8_PSEAH|nr:MULTISPECIES: AMP-binding protein [Pseudonocardia]OSY43911.1 Acetyl-coenzyme A synthetase [Pseudonocardia autotrophica]TDN74356.1 acetyl-CoA synthetase [Pseudonocardia autotrophica]BBG05120.1 AMP-dependent synthetase [Pseudonocardia autotrophica]GEC27915.1 AMP-dependent synthetase [Pseudonocardia saturnea]